MSRGKNRGEKTGKLIIIRNMVEILRKRLD
jgi:hypothetical protein